MAFTATENLGHLGDGEALVRFGGWLGGLGFECPSHLLGHQGAKLMHRERDEKSRGILSHPSRTPMRSGGTLGKWSPMSISRGLATARDTSLNCAHMSCTTDWIGAIGNLITGVAALAAVGTARGWRSQRKQEKLAEVAGPRLVREARMIVEAERFGTNEITQCAHDCSPISRRNARFALRVNSHIPLFFLRNWSSSYCPRI